mgnify:CR=1 FL=1
MREAMETALQDRTAAPAELTVTWEEVCRYLDSLAARGRRRETIQVYRPKLEAFYHFLPEDKRVAADTLELWRAALLREGYSPGTANTHVSAANGLLAYLGRRDLQLIGQLDTEEEIQPELSRTEYLRLLATARNLGRERTYLMVKVFALTGIRVSELNRVTVRAVEEGRVLTACDGRAQYVLIPACLQKELAVYLRRVGITAGPVFVTLTGQKAWEDFDDAFGLRPDAPYEEGKDGTLVPVIRLTVTRRAAAQEGQGDPHIEEKLTEGEDYTVKWTQDAETGKWTYQIWGADDPDAEEPAEPGPGQGEETTPPTEMPPEEGNQPADPPTDEEDTQNPESPADGEEDEQNPASPAEDGDGQSVAQEQTLSATSLQSDPADGEHGGTGSGPATSTDPAEDPDQIGDPDSRVPSEETPPAAQPQTELEKWAPNGARWVYTVKEELNSDLKEASYEQYQYYFTGNGTAGEDSADGDTIHMKELKNSLETRAPFTKRWVGSDGEPITADYMDLGEMSVTFELYVKEGKSGGWQRAADYFTQENLGEDAYEKLKDAGILNGFSITLENRHIYDSWSGACENLPRVVKKDSGISELSYRVVETEIAYQGGTVTITVDTSGEEFAYTVADSGGLFTGIEDTYTESGNSTTIINKLATTSLQVQKIWTNDRNNVYGTRPDTDEAGKTWETSFLIQRTTDLSVGWEAAAWEAVQVTGENGQKQDLVVTLTGTDTEGTVESPVGMTISGLPKQNAEREYTYRAVELEPGYQMTNGAVDLSSYVLLRDSYNEAYTAAYTYGGQSDDGFLTTAANDMQTTKVFAGKTWMPAGEEGAQVTLHLQYAVPLENPAEGPAYTWKTLTAVSVTLDGTADPDLDKPYYEYAEWKAVWENLPARMPGSYLPDSDSETEYRVTEAVSGSYVQVGDTKKENKTDVDGTYPEFQFTNKAVTSLTVEKKWHTADAKKHPITMELWRTTDKNLIGKTGVDGVEQVAGMTAELSAANNWRHIFGELDKVNSQNQKYYYYAIEQGTPDEDMEVIYDHGEPTETTVAFTTAITNRGYTNIPVSKTWRDDSDAQGLRPETLKLTLYRRTDPAAQGEVAGEVTLSAKNAQDGNADVWTYTFEHLPDTDGSGNPYTYWVEEEHLESYTVTGSGTLALTNTLGGKETEIAIQGRKTWVGDGADDRPNSITLSLLQNGTKVAEREVTPNADGSWTYDFGSWPAYDDSGRAYTYTVQEEPVDGYGSRVFMDDANVPSLLALPFLGCVDVNDPVYQNTRRLVLSPSNPYFFKGKAGEGIGGPHIGFNYIWPMSLIMRATTSNDEKEIRYCIETLRDTDGGTGFMHESFHKDNPSDYTRSWFAWTNTLFGELIVKLQSEGKLKDLLG